MGSFLAKRLGAIPLQVCNTTYGTTVPKVIESSCKAVVLGGHDKMQ